MKVLMLRFISKILLLQVSYCENVVDCRRFLQLVHLGENFDSTNCKNTCDNCSSRKRLIEKDVTLIAKQLVYELSEVHHVLHLLDVVSVTYLNLLWLDRLLW